MAEVEAICEGAKPAEARHPYMRWRGSRGARKPNLSVGLGSVSHRAWTQGVDQRYGRRERIALDGGTDDGVRTVGGTTAAQSYSYCSTPTMRLGMSPRGAVAWPRVDDLARSAFCGCRRGIGIHEYSKHDRRQHRCAIRGAGVGVNARLVQHQCRSRSLDRALNGSATCTVSGRRRGVRRAEASCISGRAARQDDARVNVCEDFV